MYHLSNSKKKFPSSTEVNSGYYGRNRHALKSAAPTPVLYNNVLECIGNTPLIKLNKIPKEYGIECDIYAKCEFFNPGGSSKDRIALSMMKDALNDVNVDKNKLSFVEPTSGNTGIGISFTAALQDIPCYIVTRMKNSDEKKNTMQLLGSDIVLIHNYESEMEMALKIKEMDPKNIIMLDQFENGLNPDTHYEHTGPEILTALGPVDMFVGGCGTGGTVTGVGHRLKENNPDCLVVAGDPDGSMMFDKDDGHPYLVEGVGGDAVPIVLDTSVIDLVVKVTDEEAFRMARKLAKEEGLLCGGSSGMAMVAAIKALQENYPLGKGKRVVVLLPDGIRNYMTKFVSNQWMEAHLFQEPPQLPMKWYNECVTVLNMNDQYPIFDTKTTCETALKEMGDQNLAVIRDKKTFLGVITKDYFRHLNTNPVQLPKKQPREFNFKDKAKNYLVRDCYKLALNAGKEMPTVGLLSRVLDIASFVVLGNEFEDPKTNKLYFEDKYIATAATVLDYIFEKRKKAQRGVHIF